MNMSRTAGIRILMAVAVIFAAPFYIRLHTASGATLVPDRVSAGHRLAGAWCKDCHFIEAAATGAKGSAPNFSVIANRPSTTALSLKVFLRTSHPSMPNLILAPNETDDVVDYILSLKRN